MTKQELEKEEMKKWVAKVIKNNYIEMDSSFKGCPFVYNWKQ